ncbi:MAG: DUF3078 domain-containing protein [Balneolales bacterium]
MQRLLPLFTLLMCFAMPDLASAVTTAYASPDTALVVIKKPRWDLNLRGGLNGSQAAYRNWDQGGVNNVTAIANTTFSGVYNRNKIRYTFSLAMRYGQTRLEDNEFRKSEDMIRSRNQITRRFDDERFGTVININFDTQFDEGWNNDRDAIVSRFFTPAYLTETIGFSYSPIGTDFEMDAGLAMKQTFIKDTSLSGRYGLDEGDRFRNEAGFSLIFKYEKQLMENVTYSGYLETFSNVLKKLESTDFTFNNELNGRINSYLSANFEFAIRYNDYAGSEIQIKQIFSMGFAFQFL